MRCTLCHSSNLEIIRTKIRFNISKRVYKCNQCSYVFLGKLTSKNYYNKLYGEKYGPNLRKQLTALERFKLYYPFQMEIIKEINHILKSNMKVLDIGCSTGYFLHSLKDKVKIRVGIELNNEDVQFIKRNLDFIIYNKPIENIKIKEKPFDLITAIQTLEHVDNPLTFLKNIAKLLKKNGYLYLEVPNINDILLSVYNIPAYQDFYFREPHLSYFSISSLKYILDKVGFRGNIKTVQRYNFLNHMNWIYKGEPQVDFTNGNSIPTFPIKDSVNSKVRHDFNHFIKQTDKKYKKIINKYNLGESITFLGQIK